MTITVENNQSTQTLRITIPGVDAIKALYEAIRAANPGENLPPVDFEEAADKINMLKTDGTTETAVMGTGTTGSIILDITDAEPA